MSDPLQHDDGIGATIVQVAEDAKAYTAAQVALYRAMALARWRAARVGLVLGLVAALLALVAIIALAVGLILTLSPSIGPGWATLIVVGTTLVVAAALGWVAAARLSTATGAIE